MIRQFEPTLRALEVRYPKFGSAYRIGGRLVLTAAHLFAEVGSACRVRSSQSLDEVEAKVVWKASQSDIALIELPEIIAPCEAVVFGRLPESIRGETLEFDMYGYPRWGWTQSEEGAIVGGRHIKGTIYLSDTSPDGLLVLEALRVPSEALSESGSDWEGNSGAAIICDGLVIAVQRQHQNPKRPASLEASPLWAIYSDEQWCVLLRQHGIDPEPEIAHVQEQRLYSSPVVGQKGLTGNEELRRDWGEAPGIYGFFGRTKELEILKRWVIDDRCQLVGILGTGGVGKTGLSIKLGRGGIGKTKLSAKLARGIEDEFEYVIWRRLLNKPPLTELLTDLIKFLSNQQEINLPETLDAQISRLIYYLRSHRCLIVLDNAESVLRGDDLAGQYQEGYEGYGQLLTQVGEAPHQSCLLLTSREKPQEFAILEGNTCPVHSLELNGLDYSHPK